ncbi:hypothetical protein HYALB_00011144 [Hymenoscyphus albidus]|uniref:Alpha/beta hydrolase fold-3 domain-containing protein n=1 Tax=Hymenoscyphus albidus TaxID=595503 RepID=A0A9N9PV69_9HELO|nr:hypothetical protein HYALB_00011144 [Hymenoscyphus albidus]
MPPSSSHPTTYQGPTDDPVVRPAVIGAACYPKAYHPGQATQRITLHFHGGAYVLGGCRPLESGWGPVVLSRHMKGPVSQVQYRLSVDDDSYFPAALQDGITAYAYLLEDLGIAPENVILSGESAGAHLVLSILRYLTHEGTGTLPLPRAALLWSPWVNLLPDQRTLDTHPSARGDYTKGTLLEWGASLFTPPGGDRGSPYISPLLHPFTSPVPLFIQTGTQEVLYGDHVRFVETMREVGTRVEMVEIRDAPHDTFGAGMILGFAREAEDAAERAASFTEALVDDGG